MNADLEKLKEIVQGEGWDEESRQAVADLEDKFHQAMQDQKTLTTPAIIEYVAILEEEIEQIKEKLSEETLTLTERNQIQLYERKRACRIFLEHFKPQNYVEGTIKQHLNVAEGKKDIFNAA